MRLQCYIPNFLHLHALFIKNEASNFLFFYRYLTGDFHPVTETKPDPIYKLLNAFPVILLGYACHFNAAPVYANMKNRTLSNWTKVSAISTICCFLCYSLIGIGGKLAPRYPMTFQIWTFSKHSKYFTDLYNC